MFREGFADSRQQDPGRHRIRVGVSEIPCPRCDISLISKPMPVSKKIYLSLNLFLNLLFLIL